MSHLFRLAPSGQGGLSLDVLTSAYSPNQVTLFSEFYSFLHTPKASRLSRIEPHSSGGHRGGSGEGEQIAFATVLRAVLEDQMLHAPLKPCTLRTSEKRIMGTDVA